MKPTLAIFTSLLMLMLTTTSKAQVVASAQNTQTFTFQGNFQQYIVPASGWYFLDASGAQGGSASNNSQGNLRAALHQPADISVYPNPSNGQFTVSTPSLQTDATLEVYSTDGRLVYQQTIPSTTTETSIDLQHPAAGLYQVRVVEGEVVQNLKVIVE
jgi:hypothetical protein